MILSLSGFKSTNILRMNSRAACASLWGPEIQKHRQAQAFKRQSFRGSMSVWETDVFPFFDTTVITAEYSIPLLLPQQKDDTVLGTQDRKHSCRYSKSLKTNQGLAAVFPTAWQGNCGGDYIEYITLFSSSSNLWCWERKPQKCLKTPWEFLEHLLNIVEIIISGRRWNPIYFEGLLLHCKISSLYCIYCKISVCQPKCCSLFPWICVHITLLHNQRYTGTNELISWLDNRRGFPGMFSF